MLKLEIREELAIWEKNYNYEFCIISDQVCKMYGSGEIFKKSIDHFQQIFTVIISLIWMAIIAFPPLPNKSAFYLSSRDTKPDWQKICLIISANPYTDWLAVLRWTEKFKKEILLGKIKDFGMLTYQTYTGMLTYLRLIIRRWC